MHWEPSPEEATRQLGKALELLSGRLTQSFLIPPPQIPYQANYYIQRKYPSRVTSSKRVFDPLKVTAIMAESAGVPFRPDIIAYYDGNGYTTTFYAHDRKQFLTATRLEDLYQEYDRITGYPSRDLTAQVKAIEGQKVKKPPKPVVPLIGDKERGNTIEWLIDAFTDGKLRQDEFDERMSSAAEARTQPQLDKLTRDLGQRSEPAPPKAISGPVCRSQRYCCSAMSYLHLAAILILFFTLMAIIFR